MALMSHLFSGSVLVLLLPASSTCHSTHPASTGRHAMAEGLLISQGVHQVRCRAWYIMLANLCKDASVYSQLQAQQEAVLSQLQLTGRHCQSTIVP